MARKSMVGGLPNFAEIQEFLQIYAASEASGYDVENLLDLRPSKPWRSSSPAPHKTIVQLGVHTDMIASVKPEADIFGVMPTNLARESGQYRVIGCGAVAPSPTVPAPTEVVPTGEGVGHTGTGTALDVDEGWAGAADANVVHLDAGDTMHLTFPTPVSAPVADTAEITGRQAFVIELEGETDISGAAPVLAWCRLFESGAETTDLGYKVLPQVLVDRGAITLIYTWDAGDLATSSGANVELWFRILNAGVDVHRAAWLVETADTFTSGLDVQFDSGWVTAWPALGGSYVSPIRPEEESFPPYAVHVAAEGVTYPDCQSFVVALRDDQLPTIVKDGSGFLTTLHVPRIPDGYIEAGVAIWSLGLELPRGCKFGRAGKVVDPSPTARTAGRQLLAAGRTKSRIVYADMNALPADVFAALMDRLDLVKGVVRPVLFIPNPDNSIEKQLLMVYATQQESSDFVRLETSTPLYGKVYVFEEYH